MATVLFTGHFGWLLPEALNWLSIFTLGGGEDYPEGELCVWGDG